jgi:hypothetical protein
LETNTAKEENKKNKKEERRGKELDLVGFFQ